MLAPTRWKLRRAVAAVNQGSAPSASKSTRQDLHLSDLQGFDFLGYHFDPEGWAVAKATVTKFVARATGFTSKGWGESEGSARLGE
jgi:hypothetical protein